MSVVDFGILLAIFVATCAIVHFSHERVLGVNRVRRARAWNSAATATGLIGGIGVVIFGWFVIGLAYSIGALPFAVIVSVCFAMCCMDYYQSIREDMVIADDADLRADIRRSGGHDI